MNDMSWDSDFIPYLVIHQDEIMRTLGEEQAENTRIKETLKSMEDDRITETERRTQGAIR